MTNKDQAKKNAAKISIEMVSEEDHILGLGSGTTIAYAMQFLKERIKQGLKIKAIPTSYQARFLLIQNKIPITTLNEHPVIDVAIDGADEVDPTLNLIKGGGAALTLEKIVDSAANKLIIIVDDSKMVPYLGSGFALPIEVIPQACESVKKILKEKYVVDVSLRTAVKKLGPVISDLGNFILDAKFNKIDNPKTLERELNVIPGVIDNGLFVDMADVVLVGEKDRVKKIEKK